MDHSNVADSVPAAVAGTVARSRGRYYLLAMLFLWSLITVAQGMIGFLSIPIAVATLFVLRFLLGLIEAPVYPANNRITEADAIAAIPGICGLLGALAFLSMGRLHRLELTRA